MGIRFHCPNGHKLHVKSFLAGKRGICPECGVKVIIPAPEEAAATQTPTTEPTKTASPVDSPSPPETPPTPQASNSAASNLHAPPLSPHADPLPTPPAPGNVAFWHLRIPTGEQFGPIDEAGFRSWIAEGRVSDECFVWQEGWSQWQSWGLAKANFSSPAEQIAPPAIVAVPKSSFGDSASDALPPEPNAVTNSTAIPVDIQIEPARPRPTRKSHRLVYFLVVVCFGLLIVLLYVLTRNS